MDEIWLPLERLNGYEISNLGNIRKDGINVKTEVSDAKFGYKPKNFFVPIIDGETSKFRFYIDVMVASTFLEKPLDRCQRYIIHIDGDRLNDKLENLKWGTESERQKLYRKLSVWENGLLNGKTVKEIYNLAHIKGANLSKIAEHYHCSVVTVRGIKKGEKWRNITKHPIKKG